MLLVWPQQQQGVGQIVQLQPGEGAPRVILVSAVSQDVPLSFRRKPFLCTALDHHPKVDLSDIFQ